MIVKILVLVSVLFLLSCGGEQPLHSWVQADYGVYHASLSADGQLALVATVDHGALLWDLSHNTLLHSWQHAANSASDILLTALSPQGRYALTAENKTFALWQTNSGKTLRYWQMPSNILSLQLSLGGRYALLGLHNGAQLIDLQVGSTVADYPHAGRINSVALARNFHFAVTGSDNKIATLWDVRSGKSVQQFQHQFAVNSVALSANNNYLFTSAGQFENMLWNLKKGTGLPLKLRGDWAHRLQAAHMSVTTALFSEDEQWLFTASPPSFVRQWRVATGELHNSWQLPKRTFWKPPGNLVYSMAINKEKQQLITTAADGMSYAWRLR